MLNHGKRVLLLALTVLMLAAPAHAELSSTPAWSYTPDQWTSRAGYSVASVGDVNGDGFDDVLVGAYRYASSFTDAGRVMLFYGSAQGLGSEPGWIVDGEHVEEFLGISVAAAGDVNGDGYADFLVGATGHNVGSLTQAGRAILFLGGPSGPDNTPSWVVSGDQAYANLGRVSGLGDLNGDGYADVAVAATGYDNPESYEGRVYVFLGSGVGLSSDPVWSAEGDSINALFGSAVAAGDLNGDGFRDLVVGARGYESAEGRVYVFAGGPSGLSITPSAVLGGARLSEFGAAIAVGDVNADGFDDIVVGAPWHSHYFGTNAGRVSLYLGSQSGVPTTESWATTLSGNARLGTSVHVADIDGDGAADIIAGAPGYYGWDYNQGLIWIQFGDRYSHTGMSERAWTAMGELYNGLGSAVSAADIHADGSIDLIAGASGSSKVVAFQHCVESAPQSLTLSDEGVLRWQAPPIGSPDSYNIYRSETTCYASPALVASVSGSTTSFVDPDMPASAAYYVTALNQSCESVPSNCATAGCNVPLPLIQVPGEICPWTESVASLEPPAQGSWQEVVWEITGGQFDWSGSQYAQGQSVTFISNGSGPVVLTARGWDSLGCESPVATVEIPLRTIASAVINAPLMVCPFTENVASVEPPAEGTWQEVVWEITGGQFDWSGSQYAQGQSVTFISNGSGPVVLTARGWDSLGCESPLATVEIPLRTIAPAVINAPLMVCLFTENVASVEPPAEGPWQEVVWEITGGQFDWSGSQYAQGQSVTFISNGSGPVVLTARGWDSLGCESPLATVEIPQRTIASAVINAPLMTCPWTENVASVEPPAEGTWQEVVWEITGGQFDSSGSQYAQGQSVTFISDGTGPVVLTVRAWDNLGCEAPVASHQISVEGVSASLSASGPTTFCEGGSVTLTAPDGYSYLWSNGATTQSIEMTTSGSYTVTVTNANGCSATSDPTIVTVNDLPPIPIVNPAGPTTFCEGGLVTLSAPAGYSYLWSNGATTQSIAATSTGSYSVTVTNGNGCSATSEPTSVTVSEAAPTPSISASGPTTFCEGGSVTLAAPDGYSYLWSTGATTQSIAVTASGSYSVTVTNANGCSTTSEPTNVTVSEAAPTPSISASGPTTFCEGGSVTLTAPAGYSYLWSNGATSQSIAASASGSYSVTVTNANGCSATSEPTSVTVSEAAPAPSVSASGPTTFCEGGSVTLTAPDGYSYLWSTGATTQSIAVTASGSYGVTVTNAHGCSATSAATSVTVSEAAPTPSISASGPTTFCEGGSVTLSAPAGYTYLWSNGATTQSIAATASGSYSVTVTNANGCSATSEPTNVTVSEATPTPSISASGPTAFCQGGSVTLTASAGYTYLWSNGATTQSIAVTASGSYSVAVTNANGCIATSEPTSVTVSEAAPTPSISASGPTTFCEGGSVTLTAPAGYSYFWSNGATTQSILVSSTGGYSVTVTNANGCSATSEPTTITVSEAPPTPSISASGPTAFCPGGSVTLTAPVGYTYLWSNGATTRSIQVTSTGTYTVTVTNAGGCSASSEPAAVSAMPATTITQQPQSATILKGTSVTLSVVAAAGTPAYQWFVGNSGDTKKPIAGATSSSYTTPVLGKGTFRYWVRVTGACGTVNSTTATITAK
ncbi:MAG TPA: FG-GAP-like repeat-containing protein [Thermoanaerobaculia bacterium]